MDRLTVLEALTQSMPPEFAESILAIEKAEGAKGAAVELAALLSWITASFLQPNDDAWFKSRLANIRQRGIRPGDEAFMRVAESNVDVAALTELIRQFQRDTAADFFTLHSGASGNPCESMPEIRLMLCHGRSKKDYSVENVKPFPNWIDEIYLACTSRMIQRRE
jgi:hypothetical protein